MTCLLLYATMASSAHLCLIYRTRDAVPASLKNRQQRSLISCAHALFSALSNLQIVALCRFYGQAAVDSYGALD